MNKKELWLKLKDYHFDHLVPPHLWNRMEALFGGRDASAKAFAGKIARKNGWTNQFALKALNEYKKFIYLAVVSDFNVTPSKIIDQVWHEHLLFTNAYRKFCSDVIDYSLDHNPELFPMTDQTGNFNNQYIDTIELYKKEFGAVPPSEIWSVTKFDKKDVIVGRLNSNKKKAKDNFTGNVYSDEPLVSWFDGSQQGGHSSESFHGFDGFHGGDSGGGGATGNWDANDSDSSGDSGSSDGGGSSCSSGCGGGD